MLTLYYRPTCPFCARVLNAAHILQVTLTLKDIGDEEHMRELLEKGGKRQVPFLVDDERNVSLYESGDIIEYLSTRITRENGSAGIQTVENN